MPLASVDARVSKVVASRRRVPARNARNRYEELARAVLARPGQVRDLRRSDYDGVAASCASSPFLRLHGVVFAEP